MTYERQAKPVVDAVNDAIGALSELLRSLRAAARQHAAAAKPPARTMKGRARAAVRKGRRAVRRAKEAGAAFVRGAESALRDYTEGPGGRTVHDGHERRAPDDAPRRTARRTA